MEGSKSISRIIMMTMVMMMMMTMMTMMMMTIIMMMMTMTNVSSCRPNALSSPAVGSLISAPALYHYDDDAW